MIKDYRFVVYTDKNLDINSMLKANFFFGDEVAPNKRKEVKLRYATDELDEYMLKVENARAQYRREYCIKDRKIVVDPFLFRLGFSVKVTGTSGDLTKMLNMKKLNDFVLTGRIEE